MLSHAVIKATLTGVIATGLMLLLVVLGSRSLQHFDAALFAYLFATLFAVFGIAYRYSMWLQRPPTAMYWKRGWQVFLNPRRMAVNFVMSVRRLITQYAMNAFIFKRSKPRGMAHLLIMWGSLIAFGITFPLVFGWVHFETVNNQFQHYQIYVFGIPTIIFQIHSWFGFMLFHGLVWSSILVLAGVMLAFRRRMGEHNAAAVQSFGEDILPLVMLFAISVTGLLIWVSYKWMHGYAYEFMAILHAITVILFLLMLPFGKLFHIFQRPAQMGVSFYKDAGQTGERAKCARCSTDYASQMHIDDLITVERELGYQYDLPNSGKGPDHYQRICPKCRRSMLAITQGALWANHANASSSQTKDTSSHG
jgi:hypothetical protein